MNKDMIKGYLDNVDYEMERLAEIAKAFSTVENTDLADKLFSICHSVMVDIRDIENELFGDCIEWLTNLEVKPQSVSLVDNRKLTESEIRKGLELKEIANKALKKKEDK